MRKVTKLFHFYVEKYIILTSQSVFKKEKKKGKKKKEISCRIGVIKNPSMGRMFATKQIKLPSRTSHTHKQRLETLLHK